jgi:hypothetical protein
MAGNKNSKNKGGNPRKERRLRVDEWPKRAESVP